MEPQIVPEDEWTPSSFFDEHPLDRPGHYADALKVYRAVIVREPTNIPAYLLRGVVYRNLGKDEAALADFLRAVELAEAVCREPGHSANVLIAFADALWMLKRQDEALAIYDQAIALAPEVYQPYYHKGWAKLILAHQHLREALALFQHSHELRPLDADIVWRINSVYWEMWEYERSLAALDQAIALDPTQWRFYADKATTLSYLGRNNEAIASQAFAEAMEVQELKAIEQRYRSIIADRD
jgi:Tfp pilus assembly protein PilF